MMIFMAISIGHGKKTNKIIGGEMALTPVPYIVSLRDSNMAHKCGGAILDEYHIITAAHCVFYIDRSPKEINQIFFTVGTNIDIVVNQDELYQSSSAFIPMNFEPKSVPSAQYDIAIFKLMRPIKFNANVQPVDLPTQDVIENTRVVLSGWGSQSCSLYSSIFLKKVELTITTKSLCQFYQHVSFNDDSSGLFCTAHHLGACPSFGDSGGPLVDGNTIIGIVSSGLPQYIGSPSFNCKVFDYLRWIDQIRKFTPPKIGCGGGPNPLFRL
ncbi:hypothetical protein HCN44_009425 [Aphidius gifuensis]|uniref:Peptidase S1 domain-containing protein n=1 Tax=Aphidius gifuensis TaxID=684658 RepID=A0A835CW13_APHGI|nr:hypothetical protein HCN44_009425 [Aphidius gifuensis]